VPIAADTATETAETFTVTLSNPTGATITGATATGTITDTPPADISAAGHDRGIVPIRPEHLDAWLNPEPGDLASQYRILDDREEIRYVFEESA
jgi:putative SOS response-associated peptidase YedK